MSTEENKKIVLRYFKDYDTGKLKTIEDLTASNFVDHNPLTGQALGIEGVKQASDMYRAAFPDAKIVVEDLIAEGDKVVIRWGGRGTHKGEFLGAPASNKLVDLRGISIFRVSNGKIAEQWSELNLFDIMQQIKSISV